MLILFIKLYATLTFEIRFDLLGFPVESFLEMVASAKVPAVKEIIANSEVRVL